jgi:hypothetical protein
VSSRRWFICWPLAEGDGHAASTVGMLGREFETTNRSAGRFRRGRFFAAMRALKAGRFIVAVWPLWWRRTVLPRN